MNCRRARHLLFDFVDGMSNESLRAELDRHLGECAECERFAAEMTRALALVRRAPVEALDENFNWKVRLAIHRERNALRSRSASAGAWARAWNMRYALSMGLAFGAVLVVGAVALQRAGDDPLTTAARAPRTTTASPADAARRTLVPTSRPGPWNRSSGQLVSLGESSVAGAERPQGAIDEAQSAARIDSLIADDLTRMSPQDRALYIQRWINRLQFHLESQQQSPAQR